jgi:anti-anti-sigma regulatory factor
MSQLAIEVACREDVVLATLTGTITAADAGPMVRRLAQVARLHPGRCVLDLSQIGGLCPEAIAALVQLQAEVTADGGELRLAAASPEVAIRLQRAAGTTPLRLCPSIDDALAA